TYPEPKKFDNEFAKERFNRLKRKKQAKYMHYQKLNQGIAGPSTRTRFQTSKVSSDLRAKTKGGQRDRQ
ncbi:22205_t:CDS:1, partial [Dentiscutata erythropus]